MLLNKPLSALLLASLVDAQDSQSLIGALGSQSSQLSNLNSIFSQNPDLINALGNLKNKTANAGKVTFLAPNNAALNAVNTSAGAASMLSDPGYIKALLSYHVLDGSYYTGNSGNFSNTSMFIPTQLTNQTYTNVTGGQRVEARMEGDNVTFYSALKQNASVVMGNVNFTGGVIQIVDALLMLPGNVSDTLSDANLTAAEGAIMQANLTEPLASMKDVTIFAPNNDAFNAIGSIVGNLTTDQLTHIVDYHVVNGSVNYSPDLRSGSTLRSIGGQDINVHVIDGVLFANDARVTVPNILCENGVIHVVNQVLNPDNAQASPDASATTVSPAFSGASTGTSGVPFTSGVSTATTTYPAATSAGGETAGSGNGNGNGRGAGQATSTSKRGPAMPIKTAGAMHAAALFGGAAMLANL
ncbi:FAS1 domain-containing protein [Xylariaceae sp. FL0804]|nr:FAS1 domain-containing protein [Xylariaceae sp. FL0804]